MVEHADDAAMADGAVQLLGRWRKIERIQIYRFTRSAQEKVVFAVRVEIWRDRGISKGLAAAGHAVGSRGLGDAVTARNPKQFTPLQSGCKLNRTEPKAVFDPSRLTPKSADPTWHTKKRYSVKR